MSARILLGIVGVLVGVYGAYLLLQQGVANLGATVIWLVGGVIAHDFVFAPLVLVVVVLGRRLLPVGRAPVTAVLVIVVLVTVSAIPAIGRFGARPDNPTLLPRDYGRGWLVMVAVAVVGYVLVAVVRRVLRTRKSEPEQV